MYVKIASTIPNITGIGGRRGARPPKREIHWHCTHHGRGLLDIRILSCQDLIDKLFADTCLRNQKLLTHAVAANYPIRTAGRQVPSRSSLVRNRGRLRLLFDRR